LGYYEEKSGQISLWKQEKAQNIVVETPWAAIMPDHWQKLACSMLWCCPTMADACGTPSMHKLALQSAYNAPK
jgi:hypothetical protein